MEFAQTTKLIGLYQHGSIKFNLSTLTDKKRNPICFELVYGVLDPTTPFTPTQATRVSRFLKRLRLLLFVTSKFTPDDFSLHQKIKHDTRKFSKLNKTCSTCFRCCYSVIVLLLCCLREYTRKYVVCYNNPQGFAFGCVLWMYYLDICMEACNMVKFAQC